MYMYKLFLWTRIIFNALVTWILNNTRRQSEIMKRSLKLTSQEVKISQSCHLSWILYPVLPNTGRSTLLHTYYHELTFLFYLEHKRLLQEAKLELKKSKRKDYYKILGVNKSASMEEIKKAYRKRALIHHPGNTNQIFNYSIFKCGKIFAMSKQSNSGYFRSTQSRHTR